MADESNAKRNRPSRSRGPDPETDERLSALEEFKERGDSWMKEITTQVARLASTSEGDAKKREALDKRLVDIEQRLQSLLTLTEMISASDNPFAGGGNKEGHNGHDRAGSHGGPSNVSQNVYVGGQPGNPNAPSPPEMLDLAPSPALPAHAPAAASPSSPPTTAPAPDEHPVNPAPATEPATAPASAPQPEASTPQATSSPSDPPATEHSERDSAGNDLDPARAEQGSDTTHESQNATTEVDTSEPITPEPDGETAPETPSSDGEAPEAHLPARSQIDATPNQVGASTTAAEPAGPEEAEAPREAIPANADATADEATPGAQETAEEEAAPPTTKPQPTNRPAATPKHEHPNDAVAERSTPGPTQPAPQANRADPETARLELDQLADAYEEEHPRQAGPRPMDTVVPTPRRNARSGRPSPAPTTLSAMAPDRPVGDAAKGTAEDATQRIMLLEWSRMLAKNLPRSDIEAFLDHYVDAGWVEPTLAQRVQALAHGMQTRNPARPDEEALHGIHLRTTVLLSYLDGCPVSASDAMATFRQAHALLEEDWHT